MPIYEYRCMKCNKEFEYLVFGSDSAVSCPECNGEKVKRQMSACSIKSGNNYSPASGSSGCSTCSSSNCSTCH
ncbi:zinc ribbon domain-containing protein [Thermodesulfobacteriota bacterium]